MHSLPKMYTFHHGYRMMARMTSLFKISDFHQLEYYDVWIWKPVAAGHSQLFSRIYPSIMKQHVYKNIIKKIRKRKCYPTNPGKE